MSLSRLQTTLIALLFSLAATPAPAVQTCPLAPDFSTPTTDFTDNGDFTVTHAKTGLMWKQCTEGTSGIGCLAGNPGNYSWGQAIGAAQMANLDGFAGHHDWRLPNLGELLSIVETGCITPALNLTVFPNAPSSAIYWTSTTVQGILGNAHYLAVGNGASSGTSKTNTGYALLVRGGAGFAAFDSYGGGCTLDVDGNGAQDALTDGLMILRAMFGLTGTSVTNGAVGLGASRTTWAQIRPYLNGSCAGNFSP